MIMTDIKMATDSIKSTRIRSLLTMLGVIIGVTSVVMIISLGQGVRNQVISQINQLGSDVITIHPGNGGSNQIGIGNFGSTVGTSTLTESDTAAIKALASVNDVSQSSVITGNVTTFDNKIYKNAVVAAASANTQKVLGHKIEFGEFFDDTDGNINTAIIGSNVADALFKQRDPIGRVFDIRGRDFSVRGVLTAMPENPLNIGVNYNNIIYIPIDVGKQLSSNLQISEINVRVAQGYKSNQASTAIKQALIKNHAGQEDFTILKQDEYLSSTNQLFNILTTFVATIAGISLLVGGIGIMNIMLVSVSERTHEIGVRKALGATNSQILSQFLVESTAISVVGGILGILTSLLASFLVRITTSIHPSLSLSTILVATGMATFVGIIFGMTPAIKAARKDPIEALRHE